MFNTCCCGKDPQSTDQKYFTCGALRREALRGEYNTGAVTCPSHSLSQKEPWRLPGTAVSRVISASSPKPVECFLSHRLPLHCDPQASRASLSCPHPLFPQSRKEMSSDRPSLQVDAHPGWNVKVTVFFISQQNKLQRINFSQWRWHLASQILLSSLKTGK